MKKITKIITVLALVVGVGVMLAPVSVSAVDAISETCAGIPAGDPVPTVCQGKDDDTKVLVKNVINTLLYIIGIVSVIVVIIGGLMYTLSTGDSANVTKAKNTIVYALVGLVVAFLAYAMVNWVLGAFDPSVAQQNCEKAGRTYNTTTNVCN